MSWEIGTRLGERGHDVIFLCGDFPMTAVAPLSKAHFRKVGFGPTYKISLYSYYLAYPLCAKALERHFDVLLEGWTSPFPLTPLLIRKPVVAWLHILLSWNAFREQGVLGVPNFLSESLLQKVYQNYILSSPNYVRLDRGKNVLVCPPGFDDHLLRVPVEDEHYILFLGRLGGGGMYQKGLDMLFRCFSQVRRSFPDIKLVVAGNGDSQASSKAMIISQGIEGVQFVGKVDEDAKTELLRKCTFVCMPSRFESAGIVALEAQACSKPVLGFDIPGLNFVVKNQETGYLVRPYDLEQLTRSMEQILDDPSERKRLGENGRGWASNFTWDKATDRVEEFLRSVLS
jgi:glycosyltransferase involved in cell wall biosynthesis